MTGSSQTVAPLNIGTPTIDAISLIYAYTFAALWVNYSITKFLPKQQVSALVSHSFASIFPASSSECELEFYTVDIILLTIITLSIEDQKRPDVRLCLAWSDRPPIIDPSLLVTWLTEDLAFGLPLPGRVSTYLGTC